MPHQITVVERNSLSVADGVVEDKLDSSGYVGTEEEGVEIGRWSVESEESLPSQKGLVSVLALTFSYLIYNQ